MMSSFKVFLPYYGYLKPVWKQFILGIFFGIIFSITSGLGLPVIAETVFPVLFNDLEAAPKFVHYVVENWFDGTTDGTFLLMICFLIPLIMGLRAITYFGNKYYMSYAGISVVQAMQKKLFRKVQLMPVAFFQKLKTGELITSLNSYPEQIKTLVVDMSNNLVVQPLTLISAACFLVYKSIVSQSFLICAIGLVSVPLVVFPIRRIGKTVAKRSKQLVKLNETLNSTTIESLQAPFEIRAYNLEQNQIDRFFDFLKTIMTLSMKRLRTGLLISPTLEFVSSCGIAFALYLGVKTGMEQGEFMALLIALYMSYDPIKKLGNIHRDMKTIEAAVNRFNTILEEPLTISDPENPVTFKEPVRGEIRFKNVVFDYAPDKRALNDIDITIKAGESIAIVGKSGAGKSSFVNLIPRFYDVTEGSIEIDGVDIRNYSLKELREQISYVPQAPTLFNVTVAENIGMGCLDADIGKIRQAAAQANALDFIEELPEGFDTIITERGNSLSGGQRQRIALARAFLKNSPILILDEATSSLDNESDKLIREALVRLTRNRTAIIIAHRLDSLANIERRLCFDLGKLAGDGDHTTLLKECSHYRDLTFSQGLYDSTCSLEV